MGGKKSYYSLPSKEYLLNSFGGRMEKKILFTTLQTRPIKQFGGGGRKKNHLLQTMQNEWGKAKGIILKKKH